MSIVERFTPSAISIRSTSGPKKDVGKNQGFALGSRHSTTPNQQENDAWPTQQQHYGTGEPLNEHTTNGKRNK
jgi:hypothetical protein